MKPLMITLGTIVTALYLASLPALAQGRSGGKGVDASHAASSHASTDTSPNPNSSPSSVFSHSPKLAGNLTNALSKSGISVPGGNLETFCSGNNFKTLGQCIAALHINHKFPNCSFSELASGIGKALQTCHPTGDAKAEASKAIKRANADIKSAKS